jgi:fumarylacetoacetate (FAA) hydrolase family protein
MYKYREIVERVIAESTDESPPSRRKVLAAIAEHRGAVRAVKRETLQRKAAQAVTELVAAHGWDALLEVVEGIETEVAK